MPVSVICQNMSNCDWETEILTGVNSFVERKPMLVFFHSFLNIHIEKFSSCRGDIDHAKYQFTFCLFV